jgi:hypothetical protein
MTDYDLSDINLLFLKLDFTELWIHFYPCRSNRGLKPTFTWQMLLKAQIVQWHLEIADDIEFASYLANHPKAVQLCDMPRAPSHDVLSKFTRKYGSKLGTLHGWFDTKLDLAGVFDKDDDLAGDGTSVDLHKPQSKPEKKKFGAKSNNDKFYGLWLMLIVSVNTGLIRAFNFGDAGIGQVKLMFDLLVSGMIKPGAKLFLDGIFDNKDIHAAVSFDQECLPMITYNHKRSRLTSRKDLSDEDWRGEYNPYFKDGLWFIIEFVKRTSVERTNSFLKLNTSLTKVYEKSRKTQKKSSNHIYKLIIGSIVLPQIHALLEIHTPKKATLYDFMQCEVESKCVA